MRQVLIDMHRLKSNPYNGLYSFSKNLGKALTRVPHEGMQWNFYLPEKDFGVFGDQEKYVAHKSVDKFFKPSTSRFDLWHITTQLSWYRPFNQRTKVVYTLHDFSYLIEDAQNVKRNQRLLKETQARVNRADHVTAISAFVLDEAKKYLDLSRVSSSVVYNGCNVIEYPGFDSPKYKPTRPFLFSIGLIQPRKNFHVLPALLEGNDLELVIAGIDDYGYGDEIRAAAKKAGVGDRLKMTGPVSEQEKYWYYRNCQAFVFPSYAEGFGLPVIEAMYHGKPVFISDKTSLPEVGGDAAYYFRDFEPSHMREVFANGMTDFANDNGPGKVKQQAALFSWDKAAGEYIDVYKKLL